MMSAAKMVADSTQVDPDPLLSSTKRKKSGQKKKAKKHKKQTATKKQSEEENDSDVDLSVDLKPIGDYIKSRQQMMEEMFVSLDGPSLQRHIPDVLKELPLEELKRRCLEQLEVMSKKRIMRILQGDDPANISSSGTDEESSDDGEHGEIDGEENKEREKSADKTAEDSSVTSTGGKTDSMPEDDVEKDTKSGYEEEEEDEVDDGSEEGEIQTRKIANVQTPGGETDSQTEQDVDSSNGIETDCGKGGNSDNAELGSVLTSNQMELLELEMRARAIKAMLKANEMKEKQLRENT